MSQEQITYPGNRNLIQISGGLFSVSGNEGQRRAAVQQRYDCLDLSFAQRIAAKPIFLFEDRTHLTLHKINGLKIFEKCKNQAIFFCLPFIRTNVEPT